jgi:hypothetical protein
MLNSQQRISIRLKMKRKRSKMRRVGKKATKMKM